MSYRQSRNDGHDNNGYGGGGGGGGYGGGRGSSSYGGGGYGSSRYGDGGGRSGGGGGYGGGQANGDWYNNSDSSNAVKSPDWVSLKLPAIEKHFFKPTAAFLDRPRRAVDDLRQKSQISIILGEHIVPNPLLGFDESGFPDYIQKFLREESFAAPTAIQAQGWPIALSGLNLVAIAMTGSGKTLGFLLPGVIHAKHQPALRSGEGPIIIVLAPTRELAQQINEVATKLGKACSMYSVCLSGGTSKRPQIEALRQGCEIAVATPGRLNDLLDAGVVNLKRTTYLVLDEADRMLDMGFEPQIRRIVGHIRPDRQILMWSATWPSAVKKMAEDFLGNNEYVHVNIGSQSLSANHNIMQIVDVCQEYEKQPKLHRLLEEIVTDDSKEKIIIFAETKRKVDEMTKAMRQYGYPAMCIHGDKRQEERDWVLNEFREGKSPILVATDVAARGLDVDDVKFVINYDYPSNSEDYIHRIGRTGRKGTSGTAYTFFTNKNAHKAKDLLDVLEEAKQKINPALKALAARGGSRYSGGGRGGGARNGWGGGEW